MWFADSGKKIYKQLLVVVFLSTATGSAYSQTYFHSPNNTLVANTTVNNSVTMNITQVHPGNDTLQFVWEKLSLSFPADWTATICDNTTCYPSLIDSSTTLPVLPGDDGFMLVHCFPNTNSGTGIIRYLIYEISSPLQVDTLTWIIHAGSTAGSDKPDSKPAYTLNGNDFQLTETGNGYANLSLLDLSGKEVFSAGISPGAPLAIPALPSAFYYLVLSGNNKIIRQKIWYSTN
ncbi:MAG: hypothetical protein K0S23_903 [Fluviicola sp.]|jgi:hypothetical protein|uniref:T9SS type A sorting domain-containing protein n=1 Tax=Fluviicola sp. TaxID=1917219 RepID=UPI002620BC0B|nr:T9SS type A sorting domain-containing protein [Fluviicola sp.]MDF3026596.1 hypothetical protein [Fluviicola sp.]